MNTKHTPGPWKWDCESPSDLPHSLLGPGTAEQPYDGDFILLAEVETDCCTGHLRAVMSWAHDLDACEGNMQLIQNAHTAPHECDDPKCPGNVNRLKLEAFPDLLEACKAVAIDIDCHGIIDDGNLSAKKIVDAIAKFERTTPR